MRFPEYTKKILLQSDDAVAKSHYVKYYDHHNFVFIIYERIMDDADQLENSSKKILAGLEKEEEITNSAKEALDALESLKLDLESFYVYIRALMDDICKIIKFLLRNFGEQLPESMNRLLFSTKFQEYKRINVEFFEGLKDELDWLPSFIEKRDALLHKLHNVTFISDNRGLCFDIGTEKDVRGTEKTTQNIKKFIEENISNLKHFEDVFLSHNLSKIYREEVDVPTVENKTM